MAEIWRDLVEMLRRHPALWLPVLAADLLGYLVNLGRNAILKAVVLHQTAQQSVLGGAVVHGRLTPAEVQHTTVIALLLTWSTYFVRLMLYAGAFIVIAALVQAYTQRANKPGAEIGPALRRHWGGMVELALRALSVYAIAALFFSWLTPYLASHGQTALLRSEGFEFGLTLLVLLVLAALLPPVGLRVVAGSAPSTPLVRIAQQVSFILLTVAALLASFVTANSRQLTTVPLAARYPLEIVGSLLGALPYVLLFTGLAVLARRVRRESDNAALVD